jgi:hypothetical protein
MTPWKYVVALSLLGLAVEGCGERAVKAAPAPAAIDRRPAAAEDRPAAAALLAYGDEPPLSPVPPGPPLPRARPITSASLVNTPVCLGFQPNGEFAYVVATNNDPGIPEWYVTVELAGVSGKEMQMLARTRSRKVAQAEFAALVKPINELIRDRKLVACTAAKRGRDGSLEATIQGTRTKISLDGDTLVIAPDGRPEVRLLQTEVTRLTLEAAYTAPTLPGLAIVLRDHVTGDFIPERTVRWDLPPQQIILP